MYMDPSQGPKNVNCTRHKVPKMYMDPSQGPKNAIRPVTRSQKFISASSSSSSSSGSFLLLRLPQSKGQLFRARSNFDAALSGRVLPKGDVGRVSIRPFSGPGRLKGVWGRVSTRPLRGRSCQRGRGSRFDMVLFGVEPATWNVGRASIRPFWGPRQSKEGLTWPHRSSPAHREGIIFAHSASFFEVSLKRPGS